MIEEVRAEPAAKRQAIVVLGMHRSGTSAIAGVLERLGCTTPVSQIPKGDQNPKGFFESKKIARHNDKVLASAGSNWHDWRPVNPGWLDSPAVSGMIDEAMAILNEEFADSPLIVIKDPRICRLVDYWALVLQKAGIEPLFLNIHRNPLEVTQSLLKRNHFDPSFGLLLWLRHMLDSEAATRGRRRDFTSFARLLQAWPGVISQAEDALGLRFPRMSETVAVEIDGFLSQELRHHTESAERVLANPMMSEWVRSCFEIFERWVKRGSEDNTDYADLDRIRAQFDAATPAFSRFALIGEEAVSNLHHEQSAHKATLQQKEQISGYLTRAEMDLDTARADRDALRQQLDQMTSLLRQREAELDDAGRDRDALSQTVRAHEADLENRLRELGRLAAMLNKNDAAHDAAIGKKIAEIGKLRGQIDQLNKNVAKRKAEIARTAAHARQAWEDHEAILNSTSWRITAPLRRVVDLVRRR